MLNIKINVVLNSNPCSFKMLKANHPMRSIDDTHRMVLAAASGTKLIIFLVITLTNQMIKSAERSSRPCTHRNNDLLVRLSRTIARSKYPR